MKKIFIVIILALCAGAAAFFVFRSSGTGSGSSDSSHTASGQSSAAGQADAGQNGGNSPTVMNLEGLELSQGDDGKVLWTLLAEQAEMQEQGGMIYATEPFLTYYMRTKKQAEDGQPGGTGAPVRFGEPDVADTPDIVTVKSLTGDIDQQTHNMRFIKEVLVLNGDRRMTSDELSYSGSERILTSPEKTFFASPNMNGDSGKVMWDLNTNMLFASGGVTVDWATVQSEK
ncbi:LPS export ABC transporter periplasmic protein LptC [Desulfovibrio sp. OttesenSCG-928-C06]|nr:LPS export ABC transporter periplasmic protein LptC [Desulfovibrio sp. OttesenSCG-928-C06]